MPLLLHPDKLLEMLSTLHPDTLLTVATLTMKALQGCEKLLKKKEEKKNVLFFKPNTDFFPCRIKVLLLESDCTFSDSSKSQIS